jgi:hypothetical protein
MADIRQLITIYEAHKQYGIHRETMYHRIAKGRLTAYERDNKLYIDTADLVDWQSSLHTSKHGAAFKEIPELHAQGFTDAELAKHFEVSHQRIFTLRNKLGLKANPRKPGLPKGTYLT